MTNKTDLKCPECGSSISAWADLDSTAKFKVSKNGKLTRPTISNSFQTDGRRGVECDECDWKLHAHDMDEDSPFHQPADDALSRQDAIHYLSAKRKKTE